MKTSHAGGSGPVRQLGCPAPMASIISLTDAPFTSGLVGVLVGNHESAEQHALVLLFSMFVPSLSG
jgi:hypothetical protein